MSTAPAAVIGSSASGASTTAAIGGYVNGSRSPPVTRTCPYRSPPRSHVRPPMR
ncbi:MAG TPA: hypothetical protein VKU77_27415 [Streptosporangiaceae bacterium]|nr:hypothetical protein [Streptosporangiaceae bacterium]